MSVENLLSHRLNRRKALLLCVGVATTTLTSHLEAPVAQAAPAVLTQQQETPSTPEPPKKIILGANSFDGIYRSDIEADLKEWKKKGVSLVRVMIPNKRYNDDETAQKFSRYLKAAEEQGITVAGILINRWIDQGHYPQKLNVGGYSQGFTQAPELGLPFYATINNPQENLFIGFVKTVVEKNRNRPNLIWVGGNELKHAPNYIVDYYKAVAKLVKEISPKNRFSSGLLSTLNTNLTPDKLYGVIPDLDPSFNDHDRKHRPECLDDAVWAISNGRRVDMGELGFSGENRLPAFEEAIDFWIAQGVTSISIWGFALPGQTADKIYGISKQDKDYDGIVRLTQLRAA